MFNNNKYSNVLSIILIISIVSIVAIVGVLIVKAKNAYNNSSDAALAATEFEKINENNNTIVNKIDLTGIESTNTITNSASNTKYKGFDVIGTIQIPTINLKYPILKQLTKKSLETSVVLLYTSNGVNKEGNTVVVGHNYRNGTMFSNVKKLQNGDVIYITDMSGEKVKYTVYNIYRTSGSDSEYMTRNTNGKREISLSTCTDDSKARTIVWAKED